MTSSLFTVEHIILVTACLVFACGAAGVVLRKNPVAVLMSVELMINAAILVLVPLGLGLGFYDAGLWMIAPVLVPSIYASYQDLYPAS